MFLPLLLLFFSGSGQAAFPVVTWHGLGGTASECDRMIQTIREALPEVHVINVAVGEDPDMDHFNTFLMRCLDQIDLVCEQIMADPLMSAGYNAVGISQGGLLIRGLVQRCPVPVHNLITFGAPHQGVFGVPECLEATGFYELCEMARQLLSAGAYVPWIQDLIAPAQYWHDPLNISSYIAGSHYLAPINNELEVVNEAYRAKMEELENFVMVMFNQDEIVVPKESAHFRFYRPGQDVELEALEDSALYQDNLIGLKTLNEQGKLHFFAVDGKHVQIDYDWVAQYIIPFLL